MEISIEKLAQLIDPEVWSTTYEAQRSVGSQYAWEMRRRESLAAATRVHEHLASPLAQSHS